MKVMNYVHIIWGALILVTLALGKWTHPNWLIVTAILGIIILQFGVTKFCPMAILFKKLGVKD